MMLVCALVSAAETGWTTVARLIEKKMLKSWSLAGVLCALAVAGVADDQVWNCDFSRGLEGWSHGDPNWSVDATGGRGGSAAAAWKGTSGKFNNQLSRSFAVEGGGVYRVSAWTKTDGLVRNGVATKPILSCGYADAKGRYLGSFWAAEVVDNVAQTDGWRLFEGRTPPLPSGAATLTVLLTFRDGTSGRVLFDDVEFEQLGREPIAYVTSSRYRDEAVDGSVDFHALLQLNLARHPLETLRPVFRYTDAAGTAKEVPPSVLKADEASVTLRVADLKVGRQDVHLVVRTVSGEVIAEAECPFTRFAERPRRRVWIDEHKRTWVDGRRFFPLGLYFAGDKDIATRAAYYARITNGVVNCLLPYEKMSDDAIAACNAVGVKIIYSPRTCIWGSSHCLPEYRSEVASLGRLREVAAELKDNPAILAWYVSDEAPLGQAPFLTKVARALHEADSDHPVYAVTDKPYNVRQFAASFDVVGMDPYPIGNHGDAKIDIASRWPLEAREKTWDAAAMWQVPQAFNWWWERKTEANPDHRYPRRDELANMCYQAIAAGANGLVSFCFSGMIRKDKDGTTGFERTLDVYAEIKAQTDVFLSDPGPTVMSLPTGLVVRTWALDDGTVAVLVVNTTRERVRGEVGIAGFPAWTLDLPALGYRLERLSKGMDADAIVNGVHGYMPANYVVPKEPEVRERLEWFKDQKLALMMHFGMYAQMGVYESWPLSDKDSGWSRVQVDWQPDGEAFKRQYWDLWKSFNPTRFQPEKWARLAKDNGFRYVIFTTKHHDGFCLFDTKQTDFKVTNPACPFSSNPRADIVKAVFDAFRGQGLGIAAYFSKPDWHNEDYWENHGLGKTVSRMPTYDVKAHPEKWARFRSFVKGQIIELVRDYGPLDVIWLDGGQVQRKTGLDIGIEDIISEARKYKPDLISADRTAGGTCENVITPEQTVPPQPLSVPWESCITMGTGFSYRYDDEYKSPRELVHLLLDVIAKGGNLALNIAPGPDGRLPHPAIERMEAMGAWLRANGRGVYATRPVAPFSKDKWRFTGSKDGKTVYAFRLWDAGERDLHAQVIPVDGPTAVRSVMHLATGVDVPFVVVDGGVAFRLPETFRTNAYAEGFALSL